MTSSHDAARKYYNRLARFYDLISEYHEARPRRRGIEWLDPRPGEKILEIGVGTGHAAVALAKAVGPNGRVYGIDIAERMLEQAQARLTYAGLKERVHLSQANAVALPFPSHSFDAVFMSFTLELFTADDMVSVLAECRRILRPGARLVVVCLSRRLGATLAVRIYEWGHRHFPRLLDCRPIEGEVALRHAGFIDIRVQMDSVAGLPVEVVQGTSPALTANTPDH